MEAMVKRSVWFYLSSLVLLSEGCGRLASRSTPEGQATCIVFALECSVELYVEDVGELPGQDIAVDRGRNDFPVLFAALFGDPRPAGAGGPRAPYMTIRDSDIAVWDPGGKGYRRATSSEIGDAEKKKVLLDPWGNPYVYRLVPADSEKGEKILSPLIYSIGPNGTDDTAKGRDHGDDIGNWPAERKPRGSVVTDLDRPSLWAIIFFGLVACICLYGWLRKDPNSSGSGSSYPPAPGPEDGGE
jgi:hypothetical protein